MRLAYSRCSTVVALPTSLLSPTPAEHQAASPCEALAGCWTHRTKTSPSPGRGGSPVSGLKETETHYFMWERQGCRRRGTSGEGGVGGWGQGKWEPPGAPTGSCNPGILRDSFNLSHGLPPKRFQMVHPGLWRLRSGWTERPLSMGCGGEKRHEASWIISVCQNLLANVTKELLQFMAGLEQSAVTEHSVQREGLRFALLHWDLIKKVLPNSGFQSHLLLLEFKKYICIFRHTYTYMYIYI